MRAPATRRAILRGLTTLPLVGGSVALIGSPTAASVPITGGIVATYLAWLQNERQFVAWGANARGFTPALNPGMGFHPIYSHPPEIVAGEAIRRAPLVLAAVGCPITDAEAELPWARLGPHSWREGVR